MKITTTKLNIFKRAAALIALCTGLNQTVNAQCNTNFTYTTSANSISATTTSTGTTSTTVFYWHLGNSGNGFVNSSYGATPVFDSLYNGSYILTLYVDSANGTCSPLSQTITISGGVNGPACASNFTFSAGASGAVDFTNTSPSDPYNYTTYTWNFGNGYTSSALNPSYTYPYNGTYTVTLNVFNPVTGCSTSSSQTLSISNANPAPACTSNFTYTVGTSGQVSFSTPYSSVSGSTDSSYIEWSYGDYQYSYDTSNTQHTYSYNGTYTVTLSVHDYLANCFSTTTQTISITNTANQPCVASVSYSLHKDSLNPQPGVWEVSTYYSPDVTSAVWYWGDGTSTTGFAPVHTYNAAGHYQICVKVYAACGDSATTCQNDSLYRTSNSNSIISLIVLNANATGISKNVDIDNQLSLYPNPSTGLFHVNINTVNDLKAQISISNILGEVVYTIQEPISNNTFTKEIDLQHLANGAYFIKINTGNKTYSSKLIISK